MASLLQTFARIKGTERFTNLLTGQEVSRRQRDKERLAQGNFKSYEDLAKFNKSLNEDEQLARPAKGRTSAKKLAPAIKADVVKARKEVKQQIAATKAEQLAQRRIDRKIESAKRRKIHVKKFSGRLLKSGHQATRIAFNDYDDYEKLQTDMAKSKIVLAYGLGINGVDSRTGNAATPTIFRMMDVRDLVDQDTFDDTMNDWLESRAYFIFVSYYMHIHYVESYWKPKMEKKAKK